MANKLKVIDSAGNERTVSASLVKKGIKNDKGGDVIDFFSESLFERLDRLSQGNQEAISVIPDYPEEFKPYNNTWRYEPVDSKYFFGKMIGESLTDVQQEASDVICGSDPFKFTNADYSEIDLFWGKRGGKDATIAKVFDYQCYKLACLVNPQDFLGMGIGSAIDFANVSKSAKQARDVFFKYLKNFVKKTIDPKTGRNWFSTNNFWYDIGSETFEYQDLREGSSIQKQSIDFGRGITAHSLNSDTYTGEGMNLILAVIDEVGSMPVQKVLGTDTEVGLRDSLKTTLDATSNMSKLVCVSYKYSRNCAMSVLVNRNKKEKDVFISKHSLFEVRPTFDRNRLAVEFVKNPTKAKMMYEIADVQEDIDTFYDIPYVLDAAEDEYEKYTRNPFKDKAVIIDDINGAFDKLEKWFVGKEGRVHVAHIDLAKGQVWAGKDAIGLCIAHAQDMRISLDVKIKKYLKEHLGLDYVEELEGELRTGVVVDLACHIVCKADDGEVRLADIRRFIKDLKIRRNFDFFKVTLDGWQSLESIQEFNKYGIDAEELSVDKTPRAYMTQKDLIMLGLFKIYKNRIWKREMKELMDIKGKIDHPEISIARIEQDGLEPGSKDLADSGAAVSLTIIQEIAETSNVVY